MVNAWLKTKSFYILTGLYLFIIAWWIKLQIGSTSPSEAYIFNWFYGLIPLIGAVSGIIIAYKKWGGWKSLIGRGLIFLSIGLLCQWFGLQIWTYYNVIAKIEVPYPSLADLGYFLLIPAYTLAAFEFAQAAGAKFSLRKPRGKIIGFIIPFIILIFTYYLFIVKIGFSSYDPLELFFNLAYPFGEILPVSIAIFTLTLYTSFAGGKMKSRLLLLIGAFFFQFIAEYAFLFAIGTEVYINGGINDLLYLTSYFIMSLALISFNNYE